MKCRPLSNSYLSVLCMELAMLFKAGIALSDGMLLLQDDEPHQDGKAVLQSILNGLEKDAPLSLAVRNSGYFPHYMANMLEVGEKTGRLTETLLALSEHYERQDRLAEAIKNAVLFPAVLLMLMVAVILLLVIRVLPIFNDMMSRLGAQMSPLAVRLMQCGAWLKGASVIIAAIFGVILLAALLAALMPALRQRIARAFINRWGSRGIFGAIASSRFISALALAVASGLNFEQALETASAVSGGVRPLAVRNERCMQILHSGGTLATALRQAGILSARDSRMLELAIRGGMADTAIAEIARRNERQVQDSIDSMVGMIEPTLVTVASLIVGVILLSVMLPLVSIMSSIG